MPLRSSEYDEYDVDMAAIFPLDKELLIVGANVKTSSLRIVANVNFRPSPSFYPAVDHGKYSFIYFPTIRLAVCDKGSVKATSVLFTTPPPLFHTTAHPPRISPPDFPKLYLLKGATGVTEAPVMPLPSTE